MNVLRYVTEFGIAYLTPVCLFFRLAMNISSYLAECLSCYECAMPRFKPSLRCVHGINKVLHIYLQGIDSTAGSLAVHSFQLFREHVQHHQFQLLAGFFRQRRKMNRVLKFTVSQSFWVTWGDAFVQASQMVAVYVFRSQKRMLKMLVLISNQQLFNL